MDALPHGAGELADLGAMFESVGLGEDSVRALLRLGDPKAAIDSCIRLNHWERYLSVYSSLFLELLGRSTAVSR